MAGRWLGSRTGSGAAVQIDAHVAAKPAAQLAVQPAAYPRFYHFVRGGGGFTLGAADRKLPE